MQSRQVRAKVFNMGGLQRKLLARTFPVHYPSDFRQPWAGENLLDADTTINPADLTADRLWWRLTTLNGVVGARFESKRTGTVEVVYTQAGGVGLRTVAPTVIGSRITWVDVATDLDIILDIRPTGMKWVKRMKSDSAPKDFLGQVRIISAGNITVTPAAILVNNVQANALSVGKDNADKSVADRERRRLEFENPVITNVGSRTYEVFTRWTGRTMIHLDDNSRKREWVTGEEVFPAIANQDVSEDIVANGDDGEGFSGGWYPNTCIWDGTATTVDIPGFRFQGVAVPQGATIDAGTRLRLTVQTAPPGTVSGNLYGNDIDDAPVWGVGNLPVGITRTTANEPVTITTGVSTARHALNIDTTSIVQEIVNRTGWSSLDMAFAFGPGNNTNAVRFEDFNNTPDGPADSADLEINYTAGGGADVRNHIIPAYMRINS